MNNYRVFETERFQKDLNQIAKSGSQKIFAKLKEYVYPQLRGHPAYGPNIKKLKNYSPPTWRYRVGAWRFFYEIDEAERTVFMTAGYHRSQHIRFAC